MLRNAKMMLGGTLAACALGAVAIGIAWATPPSDGFTSTPLVGPVMLDEIGTKAATDDWKLELKTRGFSDVFVSDLKLAPGAHGGWHSHPGPSIISVKSGTATFYDECNDFIPQSYPAGTGFVEDAGCVHLLVNEGSDDLEVIVMQIVPFGAPRRIDEPAPF
jgi:quercetin dioxygenase-like cupin family protein